MKMMGEELSGVDHTIIRVLKSSSNPQSTYTIAKRAKLSWSTANTHCYKLKSLGVVKNMSKKTNIGTGKKISWWLSEKTNLNVFK